MGGTLLKKRELSFGKWDFEQSPKTTPETPKNRGFAKNGTKGLG